MCVRAYARDRGAVHLKTTAQTKLSVGLLNIVLEIGREREKKKQLNNFLIGCRKKKTKLMSNFSSETIEKNSMFFFSVSLGSWCWYCLFASFKQSYNLDLNKRFRAVNIKLSSVFWIIMNCASWIIIINSSRYFENRFFERIERKNDDEKKTAHHYVFVILIYSECDSGDHFTKKKKTWTKIAS